MKAHVTITLKPGVLDPQGKAIRNALGALGFTGVDRVRQGKYIELELAESDPDRARAEIERMCESLLANLVIENASVTLEGEVEQEARRAEGPTGTKEQEARRAEGPTGTKEQEARRAEGPTGTGEQEARRAVVPDRERQTPPNAS